ncbi:hypothetical protein QC764_0067840 [Podospora pseudoanserina]|uniref:Uncharacterized protein n=1 Tax=Podospora pseudoanserina TaxID=2609844 RepID=A0ABR0IAJ1_9PEZI|nr:hypothetical protein QC764_0067840 [Podospora pseudoanserina]
MDLGEVSFRPSLCPRPSLRCSDEPAFPSRSYRAPLSVWMPRRHQPSGDIPQSAAEVDESSCPFPLPVYLQKQRHWPSAVPFLPPSEKAMSAYKRAFYPEKARGPAQIGPKQKGRAEGGWTGAGVEAGAGPSLREE